ncbi:MAG: hypothetical protein ABFC57_06315 [Veillonellales bacterium]
MIRLSKREYAQDWKNSRRVKHTKTGYYLCEDNILIKKAATYHGRYL